MEGYLRIMSGEECVQETVEGLKNNPEAAVISNSQMMENRIFETLNTTQKASHLLCGTYQYTGEYESSELCMVKYNDTLAEYLEMERVSNKTDHKSQKLMREIYFKSCSFNPEEGTFKSVKLVESTDQCEVYSVLMRVLYVIEIIDLKIVYSTLVIASIGCVGNICAIAVYLSGEYQRVQHISVYMLVKNAFELIEYVNVFIYFSSLKIFIDNDRDQWNSFTGKTHHDHVIKYGVPIVFLLSVVGRSWISAVLAIERCTAVWAPFWAREHLGRPLAIKLSVATIIGSVIFTAVDFLLSHYRISIGNIAKGMFIGGGHKVAILNMIFSFLVPWLIVLICTVATSIGMKLSSRRRLQMMGRRENQSQGGTSQRNNAIDGVLVRMVLLSMVSFIISSVPFISEIVILIMGSTTQRFIESSKTIDIIGVVEIYFLLISYALDFYFALFTRPEFRKQLNKYAKSIKSLVIKMFRCQCFTE